MDRSLTLATEMMAISPGDLDDGDRAQVCRLLFDALGVAIGGSTRPWITALSKWAHRFDNTGRARIIGQARSVAPSIAALINGAMIHSYELDDTHDPSMSHPGSVVIPAALAIGAEVDAHGGEILSAIVAGYEAMTRIGVAANASDVIEGGYHPTALFGGFGAATAAAKLLRLDAQGLLVAWGHVLSMASGSMQFSDETVGTSVKRLHAGYAAQNGVMGAEFAQEGIDAPHRAIDGKYGFLALYGRNSRPELLERDVTALHAIHGISVKPYSCCRLFHSMIDGLRAATDGFSKPAESIRSIKVGGPSVLSDQHMLRRPASSMAAQYSLPYVVGATMEFGPSGFEAYESKNLASDRILRWGDIIECHADEELERRYPTHFGTSVEISFSDGSRRLERVLDSIGTPANPMPIAAIRDKIRSLTESAKHSFEFDRLEVAIDELIRGSNLAEVHRSLMMG